MTDKSFVNGGTTPQNKKKPRVVVGLDIGTTKIACFVGVKNEYHRLPIERKAEA